MEDKKSGTRQHKSYVLVLCIQMDWSPR